MTKEQFVVNSEKQMARLNAAKLRSIAAAKAYNDYKGKDSAEEHRLSLMWQNADAQVVTAQKKLDELGKAFYLASADNPLALRYA